MKFMKKWFKNKENKKDLKFIAKAFFAFQAIIFFVFAISNRFIPATLQYMHTEKNVINPIWLWNRANFDGMHYLSIAKGGYGVYQQAFFPLYPKLISFLSGVFLGRDLLAALFINFISLFFACFFFYRLAKLDFSLKVSRRALIFLLIFPTAFYFSAVYTESLFLMLVLGSFYFAKTRKWFLAGILGMLASLTRLPGIFLFPAFLFELFSSGGLSKEKINIKVLACLLLIPLGLLVYMNFLSREFGDPLMFFHVQSLFGGGRETSRLILLYQVFWRYLRMIFTVEVFSLTYFIVWLEFLTGIGFLILTVLVFLRRLNSYAIFMVLAFIAPTLTGTFSSMPRYVLALFPGFLMLSVLAEKYILFGKVYPVLSAILFIICLVLFAQGYWLA